MQTFWLVLGTLIMGLATTYFVYRGTQVWTRLFTAARAQSPNVASLFNRLAVLTIVLWCLYPVVFLLGTEGFRAVNQAGEIFLVLDVLAKVLFGFLLLSDHQTLQEVGGGGARASRVR